ncbi:MAG: metal-sensitive transcriptional regulator [Chloroflexi bacterium]|nr:metal-sensitive transcriptional regulator [Chloroflexota bacterium]
MLPSVKQDALKRLSYVQGHLEGVRRMVDEEQYCVDVMKQLFAVRRALEKLELVLLDGHLNTCVVEGIRDGRQNQVLQELVDLYSLTTR